jgi:hypothetical protein
MLPAGQALRVHLDADGLEVDVGRAYVYVRSEVPFIVGQARHAAGFPHRIQARGALRVWPMGDRAGAVSVYR